MSIPVVLRRTARAEWSRIWTVRSSWALALATTVVALGIATIVGIDSAGEAVAERPDEGAWFNTRFIAMILLLGILAFAAITATADHGTGGIVPTLQWTPRRGLLLAGRAGVVVATTTLLGVLLVCASAVTISLLAPVLDLPSGGGSQVLGGVAFSYLAGTVLAVGLGLLTRSTAAALVLVFALVLVLPMIFAQLPWDWSRDVAVLLPGTSAVHLVTDAALDGMTVASSRLTLAAWAVGALAVGGWRLLRSDAG